MTRQDGMDGFQGIAVCIFTGSGITIGNMAKSSKGRRNQSAGTPGASGRNTTKKETPVDEFAGPPPQGLMDMSPGQLTSIVGAEPSRAERLVDLMELQTRQILKNQEKLTQAQADKSAAEIRHEKWRVILEWAICGISSLTGLILLLNGRSSTVVMGGVVVMVASLALIGWLRHLRRAE